MITLTTFVKRQVDSLPLAECVDDDKDKRTVEVKRTVAQLAQKLMQTADTALSLLANRETYHVLLQRGVMYVAVTEKTYPKQLAVRFLRDLSSEFETLHIHELNRVQNPYAFPSFAQLIQRKRDEYSNVRTQQNLDRLSKDLDEVHSIMSRNIAEVIERGTRLNQASEMASALMHDSRVFLRTSREIDLLSLWRSYAPFVVVIGLVLLVIIVRVWLF